MSAAALAIPELPDPSPRKPWAPSHRSVARHMARRASPCQQRVYELVNDVCSAAPDDEILRLRGIKRAGDPPDKLGSLSGQDYYYSRARIPIDVFIEGGCGERRSIESSLKKDVQLGFLGCEPGLNVPAPGGRYYWPIPENIRKAPLKAQRTKSQREASILHADRRAAYTHEPGQLTAVTHRDSEGAQFSALDQDPTDQQLSGGVRNSSANDAQSTARSDAQLNAMFDRGITGIKGEEVGNQLPSATTCDPNSGSSLPENAQLNDRIRAAQCTGSPACPFLIKSRESRREELASSAQKTAEAEAQKTAEAEAQNIAQALPEFSALGVLTPATVERMILASRAAILLLLVAFLRKRARQRPAWRSWGAAVIAVQQDLVHEVSAVIGLSPPSEPQPLPVEEQVYSNLGFLTEFPAEGATEITLHNRKGAVEALVELERENPGIVRRVAAAHPEFEKLSELIDRLTRVN